MQNNPCVTNFTEIGSGKYEFFDDFLFIDQKCVARLGGVNQRELNKYQKLLYLLL